MLPQLSEQEGGVSRILVANLKMHPVRLKKLITFSLDPQLIIEQTKNSFKSLKEHLSKEVTLINKQRSSQVGVRASKNAAENREKQRTLLQIRSYTYS